MSKLLRAPEHIVVESETMMVEMYSRSCVLNESRSTFDSSQPHNIIPILERLWKYINIVGRFCKRNIFVGFNIERDWYFLLIQRTYFTRNAFRMMHRRGLDVKSFNNAEFVLSEKLISLSIWIRFSRILSMQKVPFGYVRCGSLFELYLTLAL